MRKVCATLAALAWTVAIAGLAAAPVWAQRAPAQGAQAEQQAGERAAPERREAERPPAGERDGLRLPPPVTTAHTLALKDRTLRYTATAGSLALRDQDGRALAEIGYVAYGLDDTDAARRPITFAFNGGPGASSAYLHFGALGPKRLAFGNEGDGPSTPPVLVDNAETWLDFTDLVFVDPVGTGYSRFVATGEDVRRRMWSVDGDIEALARFVTNYLTQAGRLASPKVLVGESYGGFRVPKLAQALQTTHGVGVSGLVMISPVLDFTFLADSAVSPLPSVARLPAFAASALEARGQGPVTRETLAEAERYAAGDYVLDFLKGPRDKPAVTRMVDRVTALTGLERSLVARFDGRIDMRSFVRELYRDKERVGSLYDGTVTGLDPEPRAARSRFDDAVLDASVAPLTSAAIGYLYETLNWRPQGRYQLLNHEVSSRWNWGSGRNAPEAFGDLRSALALDKNLSAIVVHGFTDLVTPYFGSKLVLDQLPALGGGERVRLDVFPGGHMFYTRAASRAALHASVRSLYPAEGQ